MERLRTEDPAARRAALEELRGLGPPGVAASLRALESGRPGLAAQVQALVKRLEGVSWRERDAAMKELASLGKAARPLLEPFQTAADPETAWRIRAALAEIQERSGRDDSLDEARREALCEFLGEAGDGRAAAPLLAIAETGGAEARVRAVEALGRLRARGALDPAASEAAAERALEALQSRPPPEPRPKARLIRALGDLRAAAGVRPLAALLGDRSEKNAHVKRATAAALAAVGTGPALKAVVDALLSPDAYVRQAAAALLEEAGAGGLGVDALRSPEENREAIQKARAWWAKKYGREWED
jgi:HEAT repeat protein